MHTADLTTHQQGLASRTKPWLLLFLQMEREARFSHYVSSLQFHNLSKLDDMFRQRVVYMSGLRLVELQPHVAAGKATTHAACMTQAAAGMLWYIRIL